MSWFKSKKKKSSSTQENAAKPAPTASSSILAVGINHDCCSLLKLMRNKQQFALELSDIMSLPKECIKEGRLVTPHLLQTTLQTLLSRNKIKSHKISFALSRNLILHKQIHIPKTLTQQQIQDKATHESQKLFSDSIDELYVDFAKLESKEDHDELDIIATHKQDIEPFIAVLQKLHLKPTVVDVDYYALKRLFPYFKSQLINPSSSDHNALFYMTSEYFLMIIFCNDDIAYVHHHNFHNDTLETLIASIINSQDIDETNQENVLPAIKNIEHLLQFFFAEFTDTTISHLVLTGPLALVPNIAAHVENRVGIKSVIGNPLQGLIDLEQSKDKNIMRLSPAYTLAAAMAMRG